MGQAPKEAERTVAAKLVHFIKRRDSGKRVWKSSELHGVRRKEKT